MFQYLTVNTRSGHIRCTVLTEGSESGNVYSTITFTEFDKNNSKVQSVSMTLSNFKIFKSFLNKIFKMKYI